MEWRYSCGVGRVSQPTNYKGFTSIEPGGIAFVFVLCEAHGEAVMGGDVVDVDFGRLASKGV